MYNDKSKDPKKKKKCAKVEERIGTHGTLSFLEKVAQDGTMCGFRFQCQCRNYENFCHGYMRLYAQKFPEVHPICSRVMKIRKIQNVDNEERKKNYDRFKSTSF